jgi:hypothetical protein
MHGHGGGDDALMSDPVGPSDTTSASTSAASTGLAIDPNGTSSSGPSPTITGLFNHKLAVDPNPNATPLSTAATAAAVSAPAAATSTSATAVTPPPTASASAAVAAPAAPTSTATAAVSAAASPAANVLAALSAWLQSQSAQSSSLLQSA